MAVTVVKIGGNAAWPRESESIDTVFVDLVFQYLGERLRRSGERTILLPGGIGGQAFMEWARKAGASNALLNEVGHSLITMSARILIQVARNHFGPGRVCPTPAANLAELEHFIDCYDCVVAGVPVIGALTSDSVAALVAEHLSAPLIFIKNRRPFESTEAAAQGGTNSIDIDEAIRHAAASFTSAKAGFHPSLDLLCLTILKRSALQSSIVTRDALMSRRTGTDPVGFQLRSAQ